MTPSTTSAAPLLTDTFADASTPAGRWTSQTACLTAGNNAAGSIPACASNTDTPGNGTLRLTAAATSQRSFAILNQAINSGQGLDIKFDMYQYGGVQYQGRAGDGISFFLIDGSASPTQAGASGPGLGYSRNGAQPGVVGGYVGIGFDRFGNFSSPQSGANSPGVYMSSAWQNQVAVRGNEASNYAYVSGKASAGGLDNPSTDRTQALRRVHITLSTNNIMNVNVSYDGGATFAPEVTDLDLNTINGTAIPSTFKLGFGASTGAATNNHEIRNLAVSTLDPDLDMTVTAPTSIAPNGAGTATLTVANNAAAGPTTGPITVTSTVPAGYTPTTASGNGWTCTVSGQDVSCTRSDTLAPGNDFPPVSISLTASATPPASATLTASVATTGDSDTSNNSANGTMTTTAPDIALDVTAPQDVTPGSTVNATFTASNAATTGPTTGPITITSTIPAGYTPTAATGTGWTCSISGQDVSCTHAGPANSGETLPPVSVAMTVGATPPSSTTLSATVATTGDTTPANNTATDAITAAGPDLSTVVRAPSTIAPNSTTQTTIEVTNSTSAGPTTSPTTVTTTVPAGYTPTAATGTGWTCSISGQDVSCTSTTTIASGEAFSPIAVTLVADANPPSTATFTATTTTNGDTDTANNSGADTLNTPSPDLAVTVSPPASVSPNSTASMTVSVANIDPDDATFGPTTITSTLPDGFTPTSASGNGWTCTISGQTVTCERSASIAASGTAPDVTIAFATGPTLPTSAVLSANASTDGDIAAANNTANASIQVTQPGTPNAPDTGIGSLGSIFVIGLIGLASLLGIGLVAGRQVFGRR